MENKTISGSIFNEQLPCAILLYIPSLDDTRSVFREGFRGLNPFLKKLFQFARGFQEKKNPKPSVNFPVWLTGSS